MLYQPVIGLEIHVELNTKTKMFCRCSADYFGKEPNTHTCPVCLGLPGSLPFINKQALESCMKIGLALNCSVNQKSLFERKNYFYPDLPKGYQISQYRWPLSINGWLMVEDRKKIRINRVHQEEDTGKLSHSGSETLVDFNRSGVPLVEIVTEPDFENIEQVRNYAKKIQSIVRYLGVSNADMERGDMRLEANISVRPEGQTELPNYKVELKNINSFKFMGDAIEYEIKRQIEVLEKGEKLAHQTRGWDEDKKETFAQREKEEAHDYRYFPEPDLPEISIKELESSIKDQIPELPDQKVERFVKDYGLSQNQAMILTDSQQLADYFDEVVKISKDQNVDPKQIANYIVNQKVDPGSTDPQQIIQTVLAKKSGIIDDEAELGKLADQAIKDNPKAVEDYKAGKLNALQVLIGFVMRISQGKAESNKLKTILEKKLT